MKPLVGITTDLIDVNGTLRSAVGAAYSRAVAEAGGVPVLLPPIAALVGEHTRRCEAFVFTGGDDPRTEPFGVPTHPKANPVHPDRQRYETALLRLLESEFPDTPVLGVCLGMQMMALVAGGRLDQHMPDSRPDAARHWGGEHPVVPENAKRKAQGPTQGLALPTGIVRSHHRQAVDNPGPLATIARADDGVIEAVCDPDRRFYLGVQWHPERTNGALGADVFARLIAAALRTH